MSESANTPEPVDMDETPAATAEQTPQATPAPTDPVQVPGEGLLDSVLNDLRGSGRTPELEICAQLFSSHVPLDAGELAENLGYPLEFVVRALASLERTLSDSPLGVFRRRRDNEKGEPSVGFVLDLKPAYRRRVQSVGRPVLSASLTETLALIALNQPISQSRLVRERGSSIYEHVRELRKKGWVGRTKKGRSYELHTTETFAAEFGLPNEPELIKRALARAAGVEGQPELIGSERLQIEGEGQPPLDLVAEAQKCVIQPGENRLAAAFQELAELPPVEREDCVVSGGSVEVSESVAVTVTETADEVDVVVETEAVVEVETEAVVEVETEAVVEVEKPAPRIKYTFKEVKKMAEKTPQETTTQETSNEDSGSESRVAHLLALLGDESTNDDW